jgi:hypothetical protein
MRRGSTASSKAPSIRGNRVLEQAGSVRQLMQQVIGAIQHYTPRAAGEHNRGARCHILCCGFAGPDRLTQQYEIILAAGYAVC